MSHVVAEPCFDCKYTDLRRRLPRRLLLRRGADALYPPRGMHRLRGVRPECPVEAIFHEDNVPDDWKDFTALNAEESPKCPVITEKKDGPRRLELHQEGLSDRAGEGPRPLPSRTISRKPRPPRPGSVPVHGPDHPRGAKKKAARSDRHRGDGRPLRDRLIGVKRDYLIWSADRASPPARVIILTSTWLVDLVGDRRDAAVALEEVDDPGCLLIQ